MNKAVFLDRDGTLIKDIPYLDDPTKVELLEGVGAGLKRLQTREFKLIIISNQSGIGRKLFNYTQLQLINLKLEELLYDNYEVLINDIYYCIHTPDDNCICRKPKTFLFEQAIKEYFIDVSQSFTIGDKISDTDAGKKVGTKTILLPIAGDNINKPSYHPNPDYVAYNFTNAVNWILNR